MDNLKAEFQDFMSCMIEDTLLRLKTEDSEYGRHMENKKNSVKKIGEILNKLPSEDKKFMESYEMDVFNISAIEQRHLYKKGYLDCIKLLKVLGII